MSGFELMTLEELQLLLWDAHKDAYGYRPRGFDMDNRNAVLDMLNQCIKAMQDDVNN